MCTSVLMKGDRPFFGRNMDVYFDLDLSIVITPGRYPFEFRAAEGTCDHYAMIGMATVKEGVPLYFDAVNEHGLGISALDFPHNAFYKEKTEQGRVNIAPFEFISYLLSSCRDLSQAKEALNNITLASINFSPDLPLTPLHWHIADRNGSAVFEVTKNGSKIYDDPFDVLTNNPPFDFHTANMAHYLNLSTDCPKNGFSECGTVPFSFGLGAHGLPGDSSSTSRFVKAAFLLKNSEISEKNSGISQFFHILSAVRMVRGSVDAHGGRKDMTLYSSCADLLEGIYYYTTYDNSRICAVKMKNAELSGEKLSIFKVSDSQDIHFQN